MTVANIYTWFISYAVSSPTALMSTYIPHSLTVRGLWYVISSSQTTFPPLDFENYCFAWFCAFFPDNIWKYFYINIIHWIRSIDTFWDPLILFILMQAMLISCPGLGVILSFLENCIVYIVFPWESESHLVVSNFFQPQGLYSPRDSPG